MNRQYVWKGLDTDITTTRTVDEALDLAHLNWGVRKEPCFDMRNRQVADTWLIVRDTDNYVLGPVGNRYVPAAPKQGMAFMGDVMNIAEKDGFRMASAGMLNGGRRIWMNAKGPSHDILGHPYDPYFIFTTSFDGSSGSELINSITCPICTNTLDMARSNATRKYVVRHTARLEDRVRQAMEAFASNTSYFDEMTKKAEKYAKRRITRSEFMMMTNELFGEEDLQTDRQKGNALHLKGQFMEALRRPDLENFKSTAWHMFNAMGDFASHMTPVRKTRNWEENRLISFMDGNEWLLKTEKMLDELVAA